MKNNYCLEKQNMYEKYPKISWKYIILQQYCVKLPGNCHNLMWRQCPLADIQQQITESVKVHTAITGMTTQLILTTGTNSSQFGQDLTDVSRWELCFKSKLSYKYLFSV
jgi:hypothetical protein